MGLRTTISSLILACGVLPLAASQQQITPAPHGPFRVHANQIVGADGVAFLARGTQLTPFSLATLASDMRSGLEYGPHSSTSLSAIRLRFNMNTVRLPIDAAEASDPRFFPELARVVRRARQTDLLVILAASATPEFWTRCAAWFKDQPNLMFEASTGSASAVRAIRTAGARQPVLVPATATIDDANVIYQVSPRFAALRTEDDRASQFGSLAARAPVFATGWDLQLDDAAACASLPADPAEVSHMVKDNLEYFDAHQVSWTVSVYQPGKLIKDYSLQDATSLENGWTCGDARYPAPGMGRVVEAHLRASEERNLFVVSAGGGVDVGRGGFAIAYGPVMAQRDDRAKSSPLPLTLGGIRVLVTDSRGATRPAGIYWVSAGWGQVNYVVPSETAVGPARMTVQRDDGSRTSAPITITDTAPGFWTGVSCRGPVQGVATLAFPDGHSTSATLSTCQTWQDCRAFPIPMAAGATTRATLVGSGFRYAGSREKIQITIAGVRVPVLAFSAGAEPGRDEVTIEIPERLRGIGETDLLCHINGRVSNAVRINLGGKRPS